VAKADIIQGVQEKLATLAPGEHIPGKMADP